MRLPYLFNPIYRFARRYTPERIKPTVRGLYNMLNKKATYGHTEIFTAIDIETNSRCNLKCTYCPVSIWDRGDKYMSEELFKKIIDDIAAFPFEYKGRVSPHFYGDPLVDERMPQLMAYVREKLPKCKIIIHTNGLKLTRELYRALVDAGIDGLLITRHTLLWPKNVLEIIATEPDAKKYIVQQTLDKVGLFNRGGTKPVSKPHVSQRCYYVSDEIAIDYRGRVICTNDFFVRDSFGDVTKRSLADIWWDPQFMKTRQDLRDGRVTLQHCKECLGTATPTRHDALPKGADAEDYTLWKKPKPISQTQSI